jgi:hypothetical protein
LCLGDSRASPPPPPPSPLTTGVSGEGFTVRTSRAAREVVAVYELEETETAVVVRLAPTHPLRVPEVECTRRVGVSEGKWRKWHRSISTVLHTQNGSLLDALKLWRENVDALFTGVEECPICYSVVHATTRALPALACRTCSNKFHSACLYKWLSSSQKSTCPLCQSPF